MTDPGDADQGKAVADAQASAVTPAGGGTPPPLIPAGTPHTLRSELFWLVPTGLAVAGVTIFGFLNLKWGADASAVLAFPVSIAAIIVAVLAERGVFKTRALKVPRNRRRVGRGVAAFTVVALAGTLVVWFVRREGDPFDYMKGEVRIGYVAYEYRGWHTDDARSGGPVGFDVDVAREIEAHFEEAHVVWVDLGTLDNRIKALQGDWTIDGTPGEQDPVKLVVANFSISPPRAEVIDFAGPYFVDTQAFLSRNNAGDITLIPRGRVCVVKDSRSDEKLTQIGWNPVEENSLAACVSEYRAGRVDAVSDDRSLIAGYAKALGLKPPSRLNYGAEKYGVGMPNNMPRLCREINKVLADFLEYSWSDSFATNLNPLGLKESDYTRPRSTDPCQSAGPWYN